MQEKFSGGRKMRELCMAVGQPRPLEPQKLWFSRGARLAGVTFRQFKAAFYGEITDPEHKTVRRLRSAAERAGCREATELAQRFEAAAESMNAADQNFYRADVAALLNAARALRGLGRSGTDGSGE